MTADGNSDDTELKHAVLALVALLIEQRELNADLVAIRRSELLLADLGLPRETIGLVMGKSPDAVRKTIERARKGPNA